MQGASIIANNLTVTLQGSNILKGVSFAIQAKEHLAIVGASASGKTTLAKALAGQLFAKGTVEIHYDDHSCLHKKVLLTEQRYQFKNLSHTTDFYYQQRYNSFDTEDALTVWQELELVTGAQRLQEAKELLVQFGLYHRHNAPLIQLSSGEHKKFQLIKALLSQPQVLLLDTPFTGLDVTARKHLHTIINKLAENGTTIIVITDAHQLPDCITHVAVLESGGLTSFTQKSSFSPDSVHLQQAFQYATVSSLPVAEQADHYEEMVNMQNVSVQYGGKTILQNINWRVQSGEKWLLRGHNGAGKSTLISLINGDNPQAYKNEIYLFGKRRGTGESIWDIKQKIGYVSPELHAFFDKSTTCHHAIASGFFDTVGLFKKLSQQQEELVTQWLDFLHLIPVRNKSLLSLSFGVQRLVLLVRALVKNPPLLILDEPCQGLDEEQKNSFVHLVNDLCEELHKTLIYVSHYNNEIPDCIDHVLELKSGEQTIYSVKKKELI